MQKNKYSGYCEKSELNVGLATNGADDEVDDSIGKNCDNKTDDCVHDGVLGISNFLAVTTRDDIADAAENKHDNGNNTDGVKNSVGDFGENTVSTNKISWHTRGTSGFGAGEGRIIGIADISRIYTGSHCATS